MKKFFTTLAVLVISLNGISIAEAGIIGTKCSNSGATITKSGVEYRCKNVSGKLKWQKAPIIKSNQAYLDCMTKYAGTSGFSNDDLINATRKCSKFNPNLG